MAKATTETPAGNLPRRKRVEQKEVAIVDVAHAMFLERGYARTTIADIARKSGVADGTVYLYFRNKEDLARAVVASFYNKLTDQAQSGVDRLATTKERLRFLARHHLESVMNERRVLEMLPIFEQEVDSYDGSELFSLNKAYVAVFDRVAREGISKGEIRDIPLWALRDVFFGSMDYGARTMMIKDRRKDLDLFIANLMRLVLPDRAIHEKDGNSPQLEVVADRLERAVARLEGQSDTKK